jgi:hypothetical protein
MGPMNPRLATHQGVTAEEILYILNGRQTVPLHRMGFLVITGTYTPHRLEPQDWPFTVGEIIAVQHDNDGTREFLGRNRDPHTEWEDANWCTHQANDLETALAVADLVASDRPRGYYEWTEDGLSYYADQQRGEGNWCSWQDGSVVRVGDFVGRGFHAEYAERRRAEG